MSLRPARRLVCLSTVAALAGCNTIDHLFSQDVSVSRSQRIHEQLPAGLNIFEAEARLGNLDFSCSTRSGEYLTENGRTLTSSNFLLCIERPKTFDFDCANRDHVVVLPKQGVVDDVQVTRSPDCQRQ